MKITMKKSFAVIMALVMCVSVLFGMNLSVFAADTNTVNYVYDGTKVYNWGTRETEATFLSPMAIEFYSDNNVSLDALLALSGSSDINSVPDSALYDALYDLMATTSYTSYDATRDLFKYTDCQNSGGSISSFYSGKSIGPSWDSGSTWNREHVWPNSKSNGGSNSNTRRETDIMMLRPTSKDENGERSNKAYGEGSTYYNPNSESGGTYDLRGDVARIVLYVYVRWGGDSNYHDGALDYMWGSSGVIENKNILLKWMEQDPVDTWELGRNDSTEAILGTRNVFVDYPELAFELFNEDIPQCQTPSGYATSNGAVGGGSANTDGDDSTDTESAALTATITFDNTSKRTSVSTTQQIWEENGIVFTNNKGSGSDINESYFNPVRVYKNSEVVIEYGKTITKIDFATSGSDYAEKLESSLSSLGDISTSGNTVTLVLTQPTKSFTFTNSGGATRFNSITIYATDDISGETPDPEPEDPEEPTPDTPDEPITGTAKEVTISFASVLQRVSQDANSQVWTNEDLTFTNNKASSTNEIIDSSNPIRLYANSSITIEHSNGIKSITFAADSSTYATALTNSIGTPDGATVTKDGNNITVTFDSAVKSYTIAKLTAQVRLDAITATVLVNDTAPTVTVTAQVNNSAYGSVSVSGKYVTATPENGYEIDSTNPYTIISGTATVTRSGNSFAVNSDANVTIQINFKEREKAIITYVQLGNTMLTESVYVGATTTIATHIGNVPLGWNFAGWTTTEISSETTTEPTIIPAGQKNYTVNNNITLYAVYYYSKTETVENTAAGTKSYVKVTSAPADWSGTYLIVYETGKVAFDGSRTTLDATSNTISVTISNNTIASNTTTDASAFTINSSGHIKSASGYYVGNTSNANALKSSKTTTYTNTFSLNSDGSVNIISSSSYLRYNAASNQNRFRYYKSSSYTGQKAIQLYKLVETAGDSTTTTVTTNYYTTNPAFTDNITDGYYVKVAEDQTDWSGDYLVVFEGTNKKADAVFDGSRPTLDEAHNILNGVSANGGAITAKQSIDAAKITIEKSGDKYLIKANGKYIAPASGANGITVGTEDLHTITFVDGTVDIIGSTGSYLRFNSDNGKNNYRFRYYQASSYQNQGAITLYKWIPLESNITGAQVSVGADLSVKYYVSVTNIDSLGASTVAMRFTIGEDAPVTVEGTLVDGECTFVFTGLAPQRMGDIIKAELLLNGGVIDTKDNYSIRQNVLNLINANPENEELKQFVSDMLYYGAAAQTYTGYKKNELVTAGLEDVLNEPYAEEPSESYNELTLEAPTGDIKFKSATVWFDAVNKLIVKVNNPNSDAIKVYVTADGGAATELSFNSEVGGYMTEGIKVTDFGTVYTFELRDAGNNVLQTLTYNVNSYAYSRFTKSDDPDMVTLACALFRLGQSALEIGSL